MHRARAQQLLRPTSSTAATCLLGLWVVVCAHHRPVTGITTSSATGDVASPTTNHWTAAITPLTGVVPGVQGRADISVAASGQPATVVLYLTGLQPRQTYTWQIRQGPCSTTEPLGPPSAYAPLTIDSAGRGTATGTFPLTDPALTAYHIGVNPAGAPVIACGVIKARPPT